MLRPSSSWGGGDEGLSNRIMTIHCQQLVPQRIHGDTMLEQYIYFNRSTTKTLTARCEPGRTMEIVIAQFWNSNVGDSSADVEVEFSGVQPQLSTFGSGIVVEAKQGFARVDVSAPWGAASQALSPSAKLTHLERAVLPTRYSIVPSTEATLQTPFSRNAPTVGGHPVFILNLEYTFKVNTPASYTLHAGELSQVLYENPYGSQLRVVYDANNRTVGVTDAKAGEYSTEKLEKGTYTVRMAMRHTNPERLEDAKDTVLKLRSKLSTPVSLKCYNSLSEMLSNSPVQKVSILGGETRAFFFAAPALDTKKKFGDDACSGTTLVGSCTWLASSKSHPDSVPVRAFICAVEEKAAVDAVVEAQEAKAKKAH
jgi:tripeptidyl-peptidase-2